jgi:hypothetical protein
VNTIRGLLFAPAVIAGGLAAAPAQAEFGIGLNLGTNGFGVEAKQSLSPSFDLRFGFSGLAYDYEYEYDDVDYDVEQSLGVPYLMLDWRPMQGMFRMTLGAAYYNDVQKLEVVPEPNPYEYFNIGYGYYNYVDIGVLNGKVAWHTGMPYLGVGWDFLRGRKGLGFSIDAGAYYRGKPDVTLTATNPLNNPALTTDIARETQDIEDDAWTFIPMVQLGMVFKF